MHVPKKNYKPGLAEKLIAEEEKERNERQKKAQEEKIAQQQQEQENAEKKRLSSLLGNLLKKVEQHEKTLNDLTQHKQLLSKKARQQYAAIKADFVKVQSVKQSIEKYPNLEQKCCAIEERIKKFDLVHDAQLTASEVAAEEPTAATIPAGGFTFHPEALHAEDHKSNSPLKLNETEKKYIVKNYCVFFGATQRGSHEKKPGASHTF